jgi:hypothetical protein
LSYSAAEDREAEGAAKTVAALHEKYAGDPNVTFDFVDNSGSKSELSDLPEHVYREGEVAEEHDFVRLLGRFSVSAFCDIL